MPQHLKTLRARNVDLYTAAIRCIASGDHQQLHRLGLTEPQLQQLLRLSPLDALGLGESGVELRAWLHLMSTEALCMTLIEHGAPRELMTQLFGLSTRRYAAERQRLGVAISGRPGIRALDTATEHRIWRLWIVLADPQEPTRLRRAEHWLLIAQELPQQLRPAWSLIQQWARDDDARKAFAGDRARLTPARQRQAEHELRKRHGLPAIDLDELADGLPTETRPPPYLTRLAA